MLSLRNLTEIIADRSSSGTFTSVLHPGRLAQGVISFVALLFCVAAVPSLGGAATITYNFSYSGINTFTPAATAIGSGSFTVTYTGVGPQPPSALTGFSFVTTLTTNGPQSESSTFAYTLADVAAYPGIILGGTTANPTPSQIAVVTRAVYGTDKVFGSVAADLNMLPAGGTVLTQGFSSLGDTAGPAAWTSIVAAPEPSVMGLLAVGAVFASTVLLRLRLMDSSR